MCIRDSDNDDDDDERMKKQRRAASTTTTTSTMTTMTTMTTTTTTNGRTTDDKENVLDRDAATAMIGGERQFLLLAFDKLLEWTQARRTSFTLFLTFEAPIGTDMAGLYRSSYKNATGHTSVAGGAPRRCARSAASVGPRRQRVDGRHAV